MRVLFVTTMYFPAIGGTEVFIRQLNIELRARGHETTVVTSHGEESQAGIDHIDDVVVHRLPVHQAILSQDPAALLRLQIQLARISEGFSPDVVHAHGAGPTMWIAMRNLRRRRDPFVVTLHNIMSWHADGDLSTLGKILSEADAVTGVSKAAAADTLKYAPDVEDRLSVIVNGVNAIASVTPIPEHPVRLLCVGRHTRQKGFDVAIQAMRLLIEGSPDVMLSIVGDGPERRHLEQLAADLGVSDHVEFTGFLDHDRIASLLETCRAVVVPSRYEGLCIVAIEAALAARPVVGTTAPGLSEAFVDGETGLAVPLDDPPALAAAMRRVVEDRDLAERLGKQGRAHAERTFSMTTCADAYEQLYEKVLAEQ